MSGQKIEEFKTSKAIRAYLEIFEVTGFLHPMRESFMNYFDYHLLETNQITEGQYNQLRRTFRKTFKEEEQFFANEDNARASKRAENKAKKALQSQID